MIYKKVGELTQNLQNQYPGLKESSITVAEHTSPPFKLITQLSESQRLLSDMQREDLKFRQAVKKANAPKLTKEKPIKVSVPQWEPRLRLDPLMKYVSNYSFELSSARNPPPFYKGLNVRVSLSSNPKRKPRQTKKAPQLDHSNLEMLGQKEVSGSTKRPSKLNLRRVDRSLNRQVKNWCLKEIKHRDFYLQMVDYQSFRPKLK